MFADQQLIAEIGSVHDGSFGNALKLIEAAAGAGATAVKFQTHIAAAESLPDAPAPAYFDGEDRFSYFGRTGFTPQQWQQLADHARACGVAFLSSPFSLEAVELLHAIGVDAFKIASGEVTNLPMLRAVAETGRPTLLSSGMSSWDELDAAVDVLRQGGELAVLQCSSAYPCPPERAGLNVLSEMRDRYALPVGFSDHTTGPAAAIAAVTLGATIIEKHFTFSRQMYGSDAQFGVEPGEWRDLANWLADAARMRDSPVDKNDVSPYADMKRIFEKSVVTLVDVPAGTVLQPSHLGCKKPGTGVSAARLESVIGRTTARDLRRDAVLEEEHLL